MSATEARPAPHNPNEMLTVAEVCRELRISRSTWDRMIRLQRAPKFKRMGGKRGEIRVRRRWLDEWLEGATR
ncbi:helix-turn-helix transcriptional regulator [Nocardiopsis suaedae]|uniref:Helix-turn-helix domain-containing protein n=1 Tax=Nocardiopsis suaedae TaxID=3018444 RepID=A0ABT4TJ84_9ACTN|nr:helix-turn-helix domain-containing protein [Nocardiopsis suaedae]MDA2804470.1 helix-turn-helix domain-containing protein [Nocardiopsis suaedae]